MAKYKDEILHHVDGIAEYDNPLPGWLLAILWGAIIFSVLYLAYYALSFGPVSHESAYRHEAVQARAELQAYYDANPLVPPSATQLLAGAVDPQVIALGKARFVKTCASCHGEAAQGLIGPNLVDDRWLHGGKVIQIFSTIAKGVPAKGMPPWGRAIAPKELAALVSYIRSIHGSKPAQPKDPEGKAVKPEPLPSR